MLSGLPEILVKVAHAQTVGADYSVIMVWRLK